MRFLLLFLTALIFLGLSSCGTNQTNYGPEIKSLKANLDSLNSKQIDLETELILLKRITNMQDKNFVDISTSGIQNVGESFSVTRLEAIRHLTGLKITGRIINRDSVTYESISFRAEAKEESADFFISKITPGNSAQFSFYIPNTPENIQFINLTRQSATVLYGNY